jgi:hypothetical protein
VQYPKYRKEQAAPPRAASIASEAAAVGGAEAHALHLTTTRRAPRNRTISCGSGGSSYSRIHAQKDVARGRIAVARFADRHCPGQGSA